jgi:hypothetical protein
MVQLPLNLFTSFSNTGNILTETSVTMESQISFNFRNRQYSASYTICEREYPTYIYVSFKDNELAKEFGEEIVLHSDGGNLLLNNIYTEHRLELYVAVFNAIAAIEVLNKGSIHQARRPAQ